MDNTMPILLVPGLVSSPRIFAPVVPALWRFGPVTVANHIRDDNMGAIARTNPGRGAAALCARRAFDGRLHRLRDHAPGAGSGGKTGADQHPGAARYAGGHRTPPRHDGPRQKRRLSRRARRAVSRLRASVAARRCCLAPARPRHGRRCRGRGVLPPADRGDQPAGLAADAGLDQVSDAGADRATRTTPFPNSLSVEMANGIPGANS